MRACAPRVLLGDWNRFIRDPADLLRVSYVVAAIAEWATGDFGAGVRFLLTFLVVLAPRLLQMPRPFDFAFALAMAFQAWGNALHTFDQVHGYDTVVHFVLPCATAPILYILLSRLELVPDLAERKAPHHHLAIVVVSLAFGLSVGAVYEMWEWLDNHALGGNHAVGYDDTIKDLADDALGSLAGGALLLLWSTRGWRTSRRLPATRLPGSRG
jgi:uncharacterized membrane protein YjdF